MLTNTFLLIEYTHAHTYTHAYVNNEDVDDD